MKRNLLVVLTLVSFLTLVPVLSVNAKKPLIGTMDLQYNLGWPGPSQTDFPDWVGTVTINDLEYGMAFYAIGSGKPFGDKVTGSAFFFEEIWEIYEVDSLVFEFDADGFIIEDTYSKGEILLCGFDVGLTNMQNSNYHMKGKVEYASGIFSDWFGRSVHMMGEIEWYPFEAPHFAPGVFRIN